MLDQNRIIQIATAVATANLASANVTGVLSAPMVDSEGHDALRITIVLKPDAVAEVNGNAVLDTLVQIQEQLRQVGEDRFPVVEYATEEELLQSGDS